MIAFLSPYPELERIAKELTYGCKDIIFISGNLSSALNNSKNIVDKGVEAFITRGETTNVFQNYYSDIPIIEIPVTGFDIICALHKAKKLHNHIGVVGFESMINGVETLKEILNIEISIYYLENERDIEEKLQKAAMNGIKVVIGGVVTVENACQFGMHGILIETGKESIWQAINEARRIVAIRRQLKEKNKQFQTVLKHIDEGIVSTNIENVITYLNSAAEKILNISKNRAIGLKVSQIIPEITEDNKNSSEEQDIFIKRNKTLVKKTPIIVDHEYMGNVITIHDMNKILKNEEKIRYELYSKGHVADYRFENINTSSKKLKKVIEYAKKCSKTSSTILINGETGVGKEMFAQSIHNSSNRCKKAFIAINCAALSDNLLESELFGYEDGAFTGAKKGGKEGLFYQAHKGTIFLDEIGEISKQLQSKLLRVLQEKQIRPVGSGNSISIDVRIIAATNRDLKKEVELGNFRKDLYYRLNVLTISIPPLKERTEDIEQLLQQYIRVFTNNDKKINFSNDVKRTLLEYDWPGNVRELINVAERIVVLDKDINSVEEIQRILELKSSQLNKVMITLSGTLSEMEETIIQEMLMVCKGNKTQVAKRLGISRTSLWRLLNKENERSVSS